MRHISQSNEEKSKGIINFGGASPSDRTPNMRTKQKSHGYNEKMTRPRLSPKVALRLELLPRIAQFRSRNLITKETEAHLLTLLSETKYDDKFEADCAAISVQKQLEDIHIRSKKSKERKSGISSPKDLHKRKHVVENNAIPNKISRSKISNAELMSPTNLRKPRSYDENQYAGPDKINTSVTQTDKLSTKTTEEEVKIDENTIKNLFVEVCFFARLGFVQPPCCLRCAHHLGESYHRKEKLAARDEKCNELLIWRKKRKKNSTP